MNAGLMNAGLMSAGLTAEGTSVADGYTYQEHGQYEVPVDPMDDLQCDSCQ